jgi:hypothetical protein
MNDALEQLRDLHLPQPPGLWPLAPGWWLIAALAFLAVALLAMRLYRAHRRRRPFRSAVRALDELLARARLEQLSAREFADSVNDLLKRALVHGARRLDAAPLTGSAWLDYLDALVARNVFSRGPGAALGHARFAPDFEADHDALHAAARDAIRAIAKQARRGARPAAPP